MSISKRIAILMLTAFMSCLHAEENYTEDQIRNLNIGYNVALEHKKRTGIDFTNTVCSMQMVESSAGEEVVGDTTLKGRKVDLIQSSLGVMQIQVPVAYWAIETDPYLKKKYPQFLRSEKFSGADTIKLYKNYKYHQNMIAYYSKVIKSNKSTQKDKKYAKTMLAKHSKKYSEYLPEVRRDNRLMNKLLTDVGFSTEVALVHLTHFYKVAKRNNSRDPHFRTVSRYNGGWSNKTYYNRVVSYRPSINRLIKNNLLVARSSKHPSQFLVAVL